MAVLALRAAGAGSIQPTGGGTTPVRDGPCGVQEAVLVAARIDHNPDNNDYVAYCARRFPDRRYQLPTSTACRRPHITPPGAAEHLAEAVRTPRVHSSCELSTSTSAPTDCTGAPIIRPYAGQ